MIARAIDGDGCVDEDEDFFFRDGDGSSRHLKRRIPRALFHFSPAAKRCAD
jgi:hypothetical protein